MILIQIDKEWRITADEYQWIVQRGYVPKKGGERYWRNRAYFNTIGGCVNYISELMIRSGDAETMQELIEHVKSVAAVLNKACVAAFPEHYYSKLTVEDAHVTDQ